MTSHQDTVDAAIRNEVALIFLYEAAAGPHQLREVSPWQVLGESFLGWDHGRDEVRRYRFDRIVGEASPLSTDDTEYVQPIER